MLNKVANQILEGVSKGSNWELDLNINTWENLNDDELAEIANKIKQGEVSDFSPCDWTLIITE